MRRKVFVSFLFIVIAFQLLHAQVSYTEHTVKKGETLTILAKEYGTTPGAIIRLNQFTSKSHLKVGDIIKIPGKKVKAETTKKTTAKPALQQKTAIDTATAAREGMHVVTKGETLYRIAKNNKVTPAQLMKWNHLKNDYLRTGQVLVVHPETDSLHTAANALQPKKPKIQHSSSTTLISDTAKHQNPHVKSRVGQTRRTDTLVSALVTDTSKHQKLRSKTRVGQTRHTDTLASALKADTSKHQKLNGKSKTMHTVRVDSLITLSSLDTIKHQDLRNKTRVIHPLRTDTSALTLSRDTSKHPNLNSKTRVSHSLRKDSTTIAKFDTSKHKHLYAKSKVIHPVPADTSATTQIIIVPQSSGAVNEPAQLAGEDGYFSTKFVKGVEGHTMQTISGDAMTFKSSGGFTDKKYYILMDDLPPGSVVKVTSAQGKSIYAKVLWNMKDMSGAEGLHFRLSDAAAAALAITDEKFQLTVSYYR